MSAVTATAEGARAGHVVVPMPDGRDVARLSLDNGASLLDIRTTDGADHLVRGRFGEPLPLVWAVDAKVHVEYPLGARLLPRLRPAELRLSVRTPWSVDVHGGADRIDADLTGADVRSLAFHGGLAHARVALGRPRGRRTIRLASVDDLLLVRPADVPVRIEVAKGITGLRLDGRSLDAAARGHRDQTPGYDDAPDRYLILVSGGASSLALTTA